MNFVWSLKPIFIWLAICTGLDFDRSEKRKTIRRWFFQVLSLLFFIFYISFDIFRIAGSIIEIQYYHNSTNQVSESIISFLHTRIAWILTNILLIVFHFSLFVSAFDKLKPVWKNINLIQSNLSFPATNYRRIRRETLGGLILLSTVIPSHSYKNVLVLNQKRWFNQHTTVIDKIMNYFVL